MWRLRYPLMFKICGLFLKGQIVVHILRVCMVLCWRMRVRIVVMRIWIMQPRKSQLQMQAAHPRGL